MNHLGRVEENQGQQVVQQNTSGRCTTPSMIKVGALVIGLLLVGTGTAMYFLNVNAIAAYVTGGLGGVAILGVVIWSIVDYRRSKNGDNMNTDVSEFALDLNQVKDGKITEEKIAALLKDNPNLQKLIIHPPYPCDINHDMGLCALGAHFKYHKSVHYITDSKFRLLYIEPPKAKYFYIYLRK